jgi:hypothetical protein
MRIFLVESPRHDRRCCQRAENRPDGQLPGLFSLPCPRIHSGHEEDDVERRENVEQFEEDQVLLIPLTSIENVKISKYKDDDIEHLCKEGHPYMLEAGQ